MQDNRVVELMVELHLGLSRLGPGSKETTLKALAMCEALPESPYILDIGCGTGAQTLLLATATQGNVVALDLYAEFIHQLLNTVKTKGLLERVSAVEADMNALPFAARSFDLIWSEGAIYIMGFDNGLSKWRSLLKPGGYLVVSEAVWFNTDHPLELEEFWNRNYPLMRDVDENLAVAKALGWKLVGNFHLPAKAWSRDYYLPLAERLPRFSREHQGDEVALAVIEMTEYEMDLMNRFGTYSGYEFFIFHR